jgi:hypothetical protein
VEEVESVEISIVPIGAIGMVTATDKDGNSSVPVA